MQNEYSGKTGEKIAEICKQYGFTKCEKCPLYTACNTVREDGETQEEYTRRWEKEMVNAYKEA